MKAYLSFAIMVLAFAGNVFAADGVSLTFKTTSHNGEYKPRNCTAVWVTTSSGTFVKTIGRWAGERRRELVKWRAASGLDADAVMGATRSSHTAVLTIAWNLKNKAGSVVPDGAYTIHLECTESNGGSGENYTTIAFNKNGVAQDISYPNAGGFTNMRLVYTPPAAPEINVVGNGNSIADGDTSPTTTDHTDFGSTLVVGGTVVRTFTIENTGTAALTVSAPTISGANAGDFSITADPTSPVATSNSTTFQVTFNPSAAGVRNATVNIVNNDSNENPYNFSVRGTGTAPEINCTGNGNNIADGDVTPTTADHTDFSNAAVAGGTVVRTFTIENTGSSPLTVSTPTIGGANASDFSVTANPSGNIAAGGSTTFQVTFDPSALGERNATVSVANSDSNENPYDFAICGTGIAPEINLTGDGNDIADGDVTPRTTDHTDFGNATVSGGTVVRTFTIENTGTAALTVSAPTLTGTNAGDFAVTVDPAGPVAAGGSTTFQVTFDPSALGVRAATVNIVNGDDNENPYTFDILGKGTSGPEPEINLTGNSVSIGDGDTTPEAADHTDFGSTFIGGGTVVRTFTIDNSGGNGPLSISTPTISGTNAADFTVTVNPASSLSAGGSTMFQITFAPSSVGSRRASVSIVNGDSDENPYNFDIEGTATALPAPEIVVTGNGNSIPDGDTSPATTDHRDFGSVAVLSGIVVRTFTIANTGNAALTLSAPTIGGPNGGDFTVTANPAASVAAGDSTSFGVRFDPAALGTRSATISITNNDGNENPFDFSIQGRGANTPPVAVASSTDTPTVVGSLVTISGSGSYDPDSSPTALTYDWDCISWPNSVAKPTFAATGVTTSFTPNADGVYIFELTVDDGADPDTDTIDIVVGTVLVMTVSLPASAEEGNGEVQGTIQLNRTLNVGETVEISLASSDSSEAKVSGPVMISSGQDAAVFTVRIVNDLLVDGDQIATITASAPGLSNGTAGITVLDNGNVAPPDKYFYEADSGCRMSQDGRGVGLLPLLAVLVLLCGINWFRRARAS